MHGNSSIIGLLLALSTDFIIRNCVTGDPIGGRQDQCSISSPFQSQYIQAYLEHNVDVTHWCASNSTTQSGQEVHVINLKELPLEGADVNPLEVSLLIKPHQHRGKYKEPLVIILKSHGPTTWRIETVKIRDASPMRHLFVVSKLSTILFHNFSLRKSEIHEDLPDNSAKLIEWTEKTYGTSLTSFSEILGINSITMEVGIHSVAGIGASCEVSARTPSPHVKGANRQDRQITGCAAPTNAAQNSRSVHIIEVSGDLSSAKAEVVVDIVPEIFGSVRTDLVLILKSPDELSWRVKSRKVRGDIEIVGNSIMDTEEVRMDTVMTRVENPPYSGQDLIRWVEHRYGQILSYSSVSSSNHILVRVSQQDNQMEKPDISPYLLRRTDSVISPFKNPSDTEQAVRMGMRTLCHPAGIDVYLPKNVAQAYGIRQDYLSLRNSACRAQFNGTHYILRTSFTGCHTQVVERRGETVYSNALVIKAVTWSEHANVEWGSGGGSDEDDEYSGSGANPLGEGTHIDDEDYHVKTLEIGIQCGRGDKGDNTGKIYPGIDNRGGHFPDSQFHLDTFTDSVFRTLSQFPVYVSARQTIYAQASLAMSEAGLQLQIQNCWLSANSGDLEQHRYDIFQDGCKVAVTTAWHSVTNGNEVLTTSVQRFSFLFPTQESGTQSYLHCQVSPCRHGDGQGEQTLRKCLDPQQYCIVQHVQAARRLHGFSGPYHTVVAGPFLFKGENFVSTDRNLKRPGGSLMPSRGEVPAGSRTDSSTDKGTKKPLEGNVIIEGLDSGTVIGIAFAAFVIGVMLTAALWYIHTHTGPVKQASNGRGWAESSGETTPCSTAPIHINT